MSELEQAPEVKIIFQQLSTPAKTTLIELMHGGDIAGIKESALIGGISEHATTPEKLAKIYDELAGHKLVEKVSWDEEAEEYDTNPDRDRIRLVKGVLQQLSEQILGIPYQPTQPVSKSIFARRKP